jgi:hypothetical protein
VRFEVILVKWSNTDATVFARQNALDGAAMALARNSGKRIANGCIGLAP